MKEKMVSRRLCWYMALLMKLRNSHTWKAASRQRGLIFRTRGANLSLDVLFLWYRIVSYHSTGGYRPTSDDISSCSLHICNAILY